MMRIASSGFKANVHQGGSVSSVSIGETLRHSPRLLHVSVTLTSPGVDVLLSQDSYKICEVK